MKYLLIVVLTISTQARYWGVTYVMSEGLSSELICKNGYLTDIITGKMKGHEIRVEQSHCVNTSSWDRECEHQPIKCEGNK